MPLSEPGVTIADIVVAELVDCLVPDEMPDVQQPCDPGASPTDVASDATIEQTGSGPPPKDCE